MRLSKYILSLFVLLISSAAFANEQISVRAPDIAENGAVVPVSITLASPMMSGETLNIFSNGNLAASVYPDGLSITSFSTRVRMMGSGVIRVQLTRQQGNVIEAEKHVHITLGATIPDSGSSAVRLRQRVRDNVVKVLFTNRMAGSGHIRQMNFQSNIGMVTVEATPYMSQNPYVSFTATENLGRVNITTDDRRDD